MTAPARRRARGVRGMTAGALALAAALLAGPLHAQDDQPQPMGVWAFPEWVIQVRGQVTLSGVTVNDGRRTQATLVVTGPDGAVTRLVAPVSSQSGAFELRLRPYTAPGRYTVLALAPDGRGRDTTSFRVLTAAEAAQEPMDEYEDIEEAADSAVRTVRKLLDQLPTSPAKQEATAKLDALARELARRPERTAAFREALGGIRALATKYPQALPALAPGLGRLAQWTRASRLSREELNTQLLNSAAQGIQCERINAASEGIKVASAVLNLAGSAVAVATAFFKDFAADLAAAKLPASVAGDAGFQFATAQMVKNGNTYLEQVRKFVGRAPVPEFGESAEGAVAQSARAGAGRHEFAATVGGTIPGMLYDLAGLVTAKVFARYCEKFEGPVQAALHVDFFTATGARFWSYDIELEGRLALRYAKPEPGQRAVRVTGEFYGSGTRFGAWEDVLRSLDPKLMTGNVVFKRVFLPAGAPFTELEGRYLGALGPRAFLVPVTGDLVDRRLTLTIQPARTDFTGLEAKAFYVIAGLRTMGFPITVTVPLPYKDAHFVLTRAADARDRPLVLDVKVPTGTGAMTVDTLLERPKVKGDGNEAGYRMKLRICNPGC